MRDSAIASAKPGWLSRVFGIESGRLIACDAHRADGEWRRNETFEFLYRGARGGYFLLTDPQRWEPLAPPAARERYRTLPVKLAAEHEAFAPEPASSGAA